jgi:tetratricopeptide (TPR) repeat protein
MVQQQIDFFGHVGGLLGGAAIALVLQSRFAPPESTPRERLPLLAGLCASLLLWIYGGLGVMLALPQETLIVAAAQARGRTLQIAYLRQLTEQRPYFTEARLHLAALLFAMQRGEEAIREVTVVARTNPPLVSGNTRRGLRRQILEFQLTRGRPDLDRKDWTGAIESNQYVIDHSPSRSDRAQAHNQLAWILADKLIARLDEAEAHSRASLELQPSEPAFQDTLAWIFYRQGRYREALDQQQLALRSAEVRWGRSLDNTAELQYHLGAIYEKMRRFSEARVSYARALRARPIYPAAVEGLRRLSGDTKPADPGDPLPSQDPAVTRGII